MSSMGNRKSCLVALAVAALTLAACSKDNKEADGAQKSATGDKSSNPDKSGMARSPKAFAFVPKETTLIVSVHVSQVASSKLFTDVVGPMLQQNDATPFDRFKNACGFDPLAAIKNITVAVIDAKSEKNTMTLEGLKQDQITACINGMAKADGKTAEITQEGKLTKAVVDGQTMWLAWPNDTTTLMAPESTKATLEALIAGQGGGLSDEMKMLVAKTDTKKSVWFAFSRMDQVAPMGQAPIDAQAGYGAINVTDSLEVQAGIRQTSAEEAQKTAADATQQLAATKESNPMIGKYAEKVTISASGDEVVAKGMWTGAEIQELVPILGMLVMGMMGGGGGPGGPGGGM